MLGYCGCWFSEAAALRRKASDREITVRASATYVAGLGIVETDDETKRSPRVLVPEPVWERLRGELLFPSRKGGHLPLGEYRGVFDRALPTVRDAAKAKRQQELADDGEVITPDFPSVALHALRHTCASLAISAGANVRVRRQRSFSGCLALRPPA